jgi:hypothetical protein
MRHDHLDRRRFLAGMAACSVPNRLLAFVDGGRSASPAETGPVRDIFLDLNRIHKWDRSNGDTWDPFWADDDNLYAFNCDGRGFGTEGRNLAFNRLSGDRPFDLEGLLINPMDEYGRGGQKGPDHATWKACGQECIDNIFYAFVSRNVYGSESDDPLLRQTAGNSSIIMSADRGQTWVRSAKDNYEHPMWPGPQFGAPFFVHYGRNGGQVSRDDALDYVYAVSTNGFWNDGDNLILGRVRRSLLPKLDSADWAYYAGASNGNTTIWTKSIRDAVPILARPHKCGQTPISYVPALDTYLLISWYNTAPMKQWFKPNEIRYDFFQAHHPWGPWSPVSSCSDAFMGPGYHMYGPSLSARFQQSRGPDVEISLFTSGCPFENVAATPYKLWHIPVLLRMAPLPPSAVIPAANPSIRYRGSWFPWTTVEGTDPEKLPCATETRGDSAAMTFEGTGVQYLAHKTSGQGSVDIYLDGKLQENASLDLPDFPVFFGVVIFSAIRLARGRHDIRIVNTGDARINLASFKVFE